MSDKSKIEWTDATYNPIRGCVKISPGCKNCYAETFAERWRGIKGHPYEQGFDLRLVPEKLEEPLKWRKPRLVFVNSMSDLFQEGVPFWFVDHVFGVMQQSPQHTFQILTKRPERMAHYLCTDETLLRERVSLTGAQLKADADNALDWAMERPWPLPNVWLGVSAENQQYADERIPLLLQTPAAVRFVSYEPALEGITIRPEWTVPRATKEVWGGKPKSIYDDPHLLRPSLDWVIVGGESGPGARPFNIKWARYVVADCKAAGVACFVKQLGSSPIYRDRKGGSMEEWPKDLRVREFPEPSNILTPVG